MKLKYKCGDVLSINNYGDFVAKKYEGVLDVKVFNTLMCYEAAW